MEGVPDDPNSPLENTLILRKIMGYCSSFSELRKFRQVCKLWHSVSLSTWRSQARLSLKGDSHSTPTGENRDTSKAEFQDFHALLDTSISDPDFSSLHELHSKPFRNIRLTKFFANCYRLQTSTIRFNRLWSRLDTQSLKSLTLEDCVIFNSSQFSIFRLIFVDCPNIEKLSLHNVALVTSQSEQAEAEGPPVELDYGPPHAHLKELELVLHRDSHWNWRKFLLNLPHLEKIRFGQEVKPEFDEFTSTFGRLRREDPSKLRVKRLHLISKSTVLETSRAQVFEVISGSHEFRIPPLELEQLSLQVPMNTRGFSEFLASLSQPALRTLHLYSIPRNPEQELIPLPTLPKLQELHLEGDFTTDFEFLRKFENLRKLHLSCTADPKANFHTFPPCSHECQLEEENYFYLAAQKSPELRLEQLTHFELGKHAYIASLDERDIWALARVFPNLTSLKMPLDFQTIPAVYSHMPKLTELWVKPVCDNILDDMYLSEGIANLRELRHFTLELLPEYIKDGPVRVPTDKFVDEGLLKLPNLVSVNILHTGRESATFALFTEAARRRLRAKVPIVNIEFEQVAVDEDNMEL